MDTEDKIYMYFYPCLSVPEEKFYEAHEDVTKAKKPFVTYQVINERRIGVDESMPDEEGMAEKSEAKELTVQLDFYGKNATNDAEQFALMLELESALIRGEELNFGLLRVEPAIDTSQQLANTWERRSTVRVVLSHTTSVLDDVGLIKHVEITGEFK